MSRFENVRGRWLAAKKRKEEEEIRPANEIFDKVLDEFDRRIEKEEFTPINLSFKNGSFVVDSVDEDCKDIYQLASTCSTSMANRVIKALGEIVNKTEGFSSYIVDNNAIVSTLRILIDDEEEVKPNKKNEKNQK